MKKFVLAAILLAGAAMPASAYTSYLRPNAYWPDSADVRVEGSFASQFFTPSISVAPQLVLTGPNGANLPTDLISNDGVALRLDAELRDGGTYRVSTTEQLGAVATLVGVDGQWRSLAQGETPPVGAPVTTLQTVTLAESYITRGQATRTVVDHASGRLAIRPITHPNQVLATEGLEVEILFDGAPLVNSAVVLYAAGDADNDLDTYAVTDNAGHARFTFPAPGHYLIAARHRANMAPGAAAQVGSYTTTLSFEALSQIPAGYDVATHDAERAREEARRSRTPPRRRVGRPDY